MKHRPERTGRSLPPPGKHVVLLTALCAMFAGAGTASAQTDYDSGDTFVRTGEKGDLWCDPACSLSFRENLPPGYANAEIFLSKWSLHPFRGGSGVLGAEISSMKLELDKINYDSTTGEFTWSLDAEMIGSHGTGVGVSVWYVIVLSDSTSTALSTHLTRTTAQCNSGDTTFDCVVGPTNQANGRPIGTEFLGYAIRGFDVRTASGDLIKPWQLKVEVAGSTPSPTNATVRQTTTCAFIGDSQSGSPELVDCTVHAVGIAPASASVYNRAASTFTADWPTTWYFDEHHFAPTYPTDGPLVGLTRFDVRYPAQPNTLWLLEAGCEPSYPSQNPSHPTHISLFRSLIMQDRQLTAWEPFKGETSCMVGELLP